MHLQAILPPRTSDGLAKKGAPQGAPGGEGWGSLESGKEEHGVSNRSHQGQGEQEGGRDTVGEGFEDGGEAERGEHLDTP